MKLCAQCNHLHCALVGTHRSITSESVEHALSGAFWKHIEPWAHWQRQEGHVIVDAHSEAWLGALLGKVFVDGQHNVRSELLGTKPIAASQLNALQSPSFRDEFPDPQTSICKQQERQIHSPNLRSTFKAHQPPSTHVHLCPQMSIPVPTSNDDHLGVGTGMQHGGDLKQQWLPLRALLLGSVQNADALRGLWQSRQEAGTVPRSEETHLPNSQQTSTSAISDAN